MTYTDPPDNDPTDVGDEENQDEVLSIFEATDRTTGRLLADSDEVDETDEGEGPDDTEGSVSPPPVEQITIGERAIPLDHAQNLVDFYDWARANPQAIAIFDAYLAGEVEMVPRGQQQQQAPPEEPEVDLEELIQDPALRKEFQDLRDWRRQADQQLGYLAQNQSQAQVANAQAAVTDGVQKFSEKYNLNETEMQSLINNTVQANIVPSFAQQHGNWSDAVSAALETMYWSTPEYRDREMFRRMASDRQAKKRGRKAAALGGSSGSVPRGKSPSTPDERHAAMIADIRQAMEES